MNAKRSGSGPDERDTGTWASESLPMSVRRELLERELRKLGFRKAETARSTPGHEAGLGQPDAPSSHPRADARPERSD